MKNNIIILAASILFSCCTQVQDDRVFMPQAGFATEKMEVVAEDGGFDIEILLSKPAQRAFQIGVEFIGDAQEGVHFSVASHSLDVAQGKDKASLKVTLNNDNIWEEETSMVILLAPGEKYTVNPVEGCQAQITIHKEIVLPYIGIRVFPEDSLTNPYLAESLRFTLFSSVEIRENLPLSISAGEDFVIGTDFLINGADKGEVVFPAGATETTFEMNILKKDISGYNRYISVAPKPDVKLFMPDPSSPDSEVHMYDPIVDFSNLWRTYAQNDGVGYQQRQAILGTNGEWVGNTVCDMYVSSDGSNYLSSYRNMYSSPWGCMANTAGGNVLRLTNFVPSLAHPRDSLLADYGAASNNRFFSPCDSLFRFILDEDSNTRGIMTIDSPRTFIAFVALRSIWDGGTSPNKGWQIDSKLTGGNITQSKSADIIERIEVRLVRVEGRFDISDYEQPMLFTAWFECDSPIFMKEVDFGTYDIKQENDGSWRVNYKIYPR